ncbi:MAG: hypothetical protein M1829_004546 [Trizodia sp. TS-e1964]|nr:MAG: hypothetical protein M1829_004546 [Trizodia sp. TS-e1964]
MTTVLAKYIGKKILGETAKNHFGQEDPYFENVPATRLDGRPSKKSKKRRKAIPPGVSEHDARVLTKVKRRAYRLDMSLFNFCGIRFGWGSVIGFIPLIGDFIDAFMALMVIRTCEQIEGGLPRSLQTQMYLNAVLDFAIGLVPFLGDIADALYRCNTRNAVALERHLRSVGAARIARQGQSAPVIDPSDPSEFDRVSEDETDPPPSYAPGPHQQSGAEDRQIPPVRPKPAKSPRVGGSWWFGGGSRDVEPDLESGEDEAPVRDTRRDSRLQKARPT